MLYQVAQLILLRSTMSNVLEVVGGLYMSIKAPILPPCHLDNIFRWHIKLKSR